jgi:hypothetical protein
MSGAHAVARPMSGADAAQGRSISGTVAVTEHSSAGNRPAAAPPPPSLQHDAFAELRALLERPEEPPRG